MPEEVKQNALDAVRTLQTYLENDGWHPQALDNHVFRAVYGGKNAKLACFAQIRVDKEQFLFYISAPVKAQEERRLAVAEFLTRANWSLRIGNFELDFSDGEMRYKSSIDFQDFPLTDLMIRNAIYPAVQTMDRYFIGFLAVLSDTKTPAQAIAEVEG